MTSPSFCFTLKKTTLTQRQFSRWVHPQVRNIVHEFYTILKKIDGIHGGLIEIKNKILKVTLHWEEWKKTCLPLLPPCHGQLKQSYETMRQVNVLIGPLQRELFHIPPSTISEKIDARIHLAFQLDRLATFSYQILHLLEGMMMSTRIPYAHPPPPPSEDPFGQLLHNMLLTSELTITGQVDKKIKEEFDYLWANFIKVLELYVVFKRQKDYLVKGLETFNISWNSFHMKLSKDHNKLPRHLLNTLKIMHGRWNSILKIILKTK